MSRGFKAKSYIVYGTGYDWNGTPLPRKRERVSVLNHAINLATQWHKIDGLDTRIVPSVAKVKRGRGGREAPARLPARFADKRA